MTLLNNHDVECPNCGNNENVYLHSSVNIQVDPKLLKAVIKRKINNFQCSRCHTFYELIDRFLFVDMKKGKWIWVYPFANNKDRTLIVDQLKTSVVEKMSNIINEISGAQMEVVFGYDELFEKLDYNITNKKREDPQNLFDMVDFSEKKLSQEEKGKIMRQVEELLTELVGNSTLEERKEIDKMLKMWKIRLLFIGALEEAKEEQDAEELESKK